VDVEAVAELAWPPAVVFAQVRDLGGYPAWLGIVHQAICEVPDVPAAGGAVGDPDGGSAVAWLVDLGARLGPVRRSKRVRMVRVTDEAPALARFERVECDGRAHSAWVLTARIEGLEGLAVGASAGSRLTVHLHYGGRAWLPLVELALRDEIRRAGPRLDAVLEAGSPS
jgi:Polyketide cyclase / dehydrase and lipid transport